MKKWSKGSKVDANFGDTTFRDQEISVIDVKSDTLEDSLSNFVPF